MWNSIVSVPDHCLFIYFDIVFSVNCHFILFFTQKCGRGKTKLCEFTSVVLLILEKIESAVPRT